MSWVNWLMIMGVGENSSSYYSDCCRGKFSRLQGINLDGLLFSIGELLVHVRSEPDYSISVSIWLPVFL